MFICPTLDLHAYHLDVRDMPYGILLRHVGLLEFVVKRRVRCTQHLFELGYVNIVLFQTYL